MKYDLIVEGMSCSHCEKAVTDAVMALQTVSDIKVELSTKRVLITCGDIESKVLKDAIEDQGYDVAEIKQVSD